MNRSECANSLVLSATLITLCINRQMPTTILDIPVTCCQVTTCDRNSQLSGSYFIYFYDIKVKSQLAMAVYVRIASNQKHRFAALCRSRTPAFLCSSDNIIFTDYLNLQGGCFSPEKHLYGSAPRLQQRRHYASVGDAARKVGAGWFRRKLYTLLVVAGVSGGALIYVSREPSSLSGHYFGYVSQADRGLQYMHVMVRLHDMCTALYVYVATRFLFQFPV